MPQRQGRRLGVRTNATIRRNEFERHGNPEELLIDKNSQVSLSLSKSKRWELLNDKEQQLPIHKMLSITTSNCKVSPFRPRYFPGGAFVDYDQARNYQSINGKRSNIDLDKHESIDTWIQLPFENHEYPLKRELRKKHDTPCRGCLAHGGVKLFRGRGKKSFGKTKGMKSYRHKDWEDEFNL